MTLGPEHLKPIVEKALFYPCCGKDLLLPIDLFASVVSDFYFVDIKRPPCPKLDRIADYRTEAQVEVGSKIDSFLHRASEHEFRLHCW